MKPATRTRVDVPETETDAMPARILIIEDEALVALELRFVLEDLGHEVVGIAADSRQAEDLIKTADVDLALVDIHLSDGPTGIELGRHLGQDHRVAVLFMTANPGMVRNGVAGTIGVLSKPTDERAVRTAVDYALGKRAGSPPPMAPPELQLFG
ncbi:MAG: response regulator [Caulobacteraceae bacterium]|nr:response regulator [Caulobacteraceae bacterium]